MRARSGVYVAKGAFIRRQNGRRNADYAELSYRDNELPDTCQVIKIAHTVKSESCVSENTTFNDVNLDSFRSIVKLLRVSCIIIRICKNKLFCQNASKVSAEEFQNAEKEWIRYVQTEILRI